VADSGQEAHEACEARLQRWQLVAAPARLVRLLARVHHLGLLAAHARLARPPPRFVQPPREPSQRSRASRACRPKSASCRWSAAKRSRSQDPIDWNTLP